MRADLYVSGFDPSYSRSLCWQIDIRQQQNIAAHGEAISHPQSRAVLGHPLRDERVVDGLSFDVSDPLFALGADEIRLIGKQRGYAQLSRQQFDLSLIRRPETPDQDEQRFGVLLGQVLESLIVRFRAHGLNYE